MNDDEQSQNIISEEEVDGELECPVCHELLICPVTLMCQHTFCRLCVKTYVKQQVNAQSNDSDHGIYTAPTDRNAKCPICRCTIVIPPNDNYTLKSILEAKYPDLYHARLENFHKKGLLKLDIRDQIEDEIRNEIFNGIIDNVVYKKNNTKDYEDEEDEDTDVRSYVTKRNHWISNIVANKNNLILWWGVGCLSCILLSAKYGISTKTMLGACTVSWGILIYLYTRY